MRSNFGRRMYYTLSCAWYRYLDDIFEIRVNGNDALTHFLD